MADPHRHPIVAAKQQLSGMVGMRAMRRSGVQKPPPDALAGIGGGAHAQNKSRRRAVG